MVNADPIPFTGQLLEPGLLAVPGDLNASLGDADTLGMENPFVGKLGDRHRGIWSL